MCCCSPYTWNSLPFSLSFNRFSRRGVACSSGANIRALTWLDAACGCDLSRSWSRSPSGDRVAGERLLKLREHVRLRFLRDANAVTIALTERELGLAHRMKDECLFWQFVLVLKRKMVSDVVVCPWKPLPTTSIPRVEETLVSDVSLTKGFRCFQREQSARLDK